MRNLKKFLALVLAMLMVVSAGAAVSAFDDVADDNAYAVAIEDLAEKEIVRGRTAETFDPDANVTRWQMALFIVRAITGNTVDADWADGFCFFDDVVAGQYPGAISKAAAAGIILGRDEDTFDPNADVNFAEALTMAVRALGYEEKDKDGNVTFAYPNDYLAKAIDLGLTKNVNVTDKYQALTRAETVQIIYNMIYAERNGKDLTFAEEYFGEIGVSNANAYVLVATPKQAFPGFDVVDPDDEVVVLAKLDAYGNFADELLVKLDALEIDYAEAEELFGSTVLLVNLNEKNNTFARCEFLDNDVVTNAAVAAKTGEKITINGRTYYIVEDYSDTTIRNEIVIYDGSADMDIMKKADLTGNYQLVLADDDQNGIYDRAVFQPIYVSVFNAFDGEKDKTAGIWAADAKNTYTEDLNKGDVFTYTYNAKTLIVDVIDVLDYQEGVLSAINTTDVNTNSGSNQYAVKVTIDGTVYTLGNAKREAAGLTGANVASTTSDIVFANIAGKKSNTDGSAVTPVINYASPAQYLNLALGASVRFYAIDDQIVYVENTYTAAATENLAVIKKITSWDSEAIYADIYMNGELAEDVKIVKFVDVDFSKLNQFTLSMKLSEIYTGTPEGTVVSVIKNTDGSYTVTKIRSEAASFDILPLESTSGRTFKDSIADQNAAGGSVNNSRALRTNSSTVFYFIETANDNANTPKSVKVFVGVPENGSTISGNAKIYANKIGFGLADTNGVASVVIVTYKSADDVTGFGGVVKANPTKTTTVYVATTGTISKVLGSTFGLTGADANANYYSYTADKLALDMTTGKVVKTVYVKADYRATFEAALAANGKDFFTVDANGVVTGKATEGIYSGDLTAIEDARYITITIGGTAIDTLTSVITVKDTDLASSKVGYEWIKDYKQNVYAVKTDKTLVVLINSTPVDPGTGDGDEETVVGNIVVTLDGEIAEKLVGVADIKVNDGVVDGTVSLYWDNKLLTSTIGEDAAFLKSLKYKTAGSVKYTEIADVDVDATYDKGVLTIKEFVDEAGFTFIFPAAQYEAVIEFATSTGSVITVTLPIAVSAK